MNRKRLKRLLLVTLGIILAVCTPIDEILLIAAVSAITYNYVRRRTLCLLLSLENKSLKK